MDDSGLLLPPSVKTTVWSLDGGVRSGWGRHLDDSRAYGILIVLAVTKGQQRTVVCPFSAVCAHQQIV